MNPEFKTQMEQEPTINEQLKALSEGEVIRVNIGEGVITKVDERNNTYGRAGISDFEFVKFDEEKGILTVNDIEYRGFRSADGFRTLDLPLAKIKTVELIAPSKDYYLENFGPKNLPPDFLD